jgi:Cu/Ag efflux pump CusA
MITNSGRRGQLVSIVVWSQASIIRLSIRSCGIVIALACILVAVGVYALGDAKLAVFPKFAPPQVSI